MQRLELTTFVNNRCFCPAVLLPPPPRVVPASFAVTGTPSSMVYSIYTIATTGVTPHLISSHPISSSHLIISSHPIIPSHLTLSYPVSSHPIISSHLIPSHPISSHLIISSSHLNPSHPIPSTLFPPPSGSVLAALYVHRFKVKEFSVVEIVPYPIRLSWEGDAGADGGDKMATGGESCFTLALKIIYRIVNVSVVIYYING